MAGAGVVMAAGASTGASTDVRGRAVGVVLRRRIRVRAALEATLRIESVIGSIRRLGESPMRSTLFSWGRNNKRGLVPTQ